MQPTTRSRPHHGATRAVKPGSGPDSALAAIERKVYVLKPDWLDTLAGDDTRLRNRTTGEPLVTVISAAAGLDRTTLTHIKSGKKGLSPAVMGSLESFLELHRGLTQQEAREALFDRIPQPKAVERPEKPVAA